MKIYNLGVLIEPKEGCSEADIMKEIFQQIEKDGMELIICQVGGDIAHEVIKKNDLASFPDSLTKGTKRLAYQLSLPTRKDLGRRWFLKRLEGQKKNSYRLIATTDVSVIHIETN